MVLDGEQWLLRLQSITIFAFGNMISLFIVLTWPIRYTFYTYLIIVEL
jgi:hypothetical protein